MGEKFLYVMAQFDSETEKRLNKIQEKLFDAGILGNQTPNIPNHITLGSFEVEKEYDLIDKVKEVSSKTKKIEVSFNNIGLFGLKVLFIAPSITHELLNLQEKFNNISHGEFNWTPHITMLIEERDKILQALPIVNEHFDSFSGYIESISLYEFSPSRFILEEKLL